MLKLGFVPDVGVEGFGDEVVPGLRVGGDGLLEEPVEEEASRLGVAPVEPEGELIQIEVEVLVADAVVQGAFHPALQQGGHAVGAGQAHMGRLSGGDDVDGLVVEAPLAEVSVGDQAISAHGGSGRHRVADEPAQLSTFTEFTGATFR